MDDRLIVDGQRGEVVIEPVAKSVGIGNVFDGDECRDTIQAARTVDHT